ncbi:uncharacterized protein LOC135693090 isoform X2 [Rhopilema esculentum]|uniref:uncharacterized protein LOC135693090 isoform X2 n=1 Tax=Rhopilema esculentum TaxID=499914 RepID=UPI0031DFD33F
MELRRTGPMENFLNDLECIAAKYGNVTDEDDPGKFLSEYEDDLQNDISSEDQLDDSDSTEDSFSTTYTEEEGRFLAKLRNCLIKMEKSEPPPPLEEYPRDILIEDDWGNEEPNHGPCEDSPAAFHITKLSDWYLSVTNQKSVIINGRRCDTVKTEDDDWHTTAIKTRIGNNPKKLMTISGSIYHLEDEINEKAMQENNFPMSVIERFRFGFPKDWQTIIKDLLLNCSTRHSIDTTKGTSVTYSDTDELSDSLESSSPPKRTVENWKDSHDENPRDQTLAPNKRRKLEWEATPDIIFDFPAETVFAIPQFAQSCTALDSGRGKVKDDVEKNKDDDLLSNFAGNRDLGDNYLFDTEIKMKIAVKHEGGDTNDPKCGNIATKRRKKYKFYTGTYKKRKQRTISRKDVPAKKDFTKIESMPSSINEKRRGSDFKETYPETDFKGTEKADDVKEQADIVLKNDSRPKLEISCEMDHETLPSGLQEGIRINEKQNDTKREVNTLRFPNKGEQIEVTTCDKILANNLLVYIQPIKMDDYRKKTSENCVYLSDPLMQIAQSNPNISNNEQNKRNSIEISETVPGKILIPKSARKEISQSLKMLPNKKKEVRFVPEPELNARREKKFKDKSFTGYYSQVRKNTEKNASLTKHSLVRNYQRHPSYKTNRVDPINKLSQIHCATANPSVGILKSPRVYIEPLKLQGYRRKSSEKDVNTFDGRKSESRESSFQRNRSDRITRFSKTPHASVNRSDVITDSSDEDILPWASAHPKELLLSRSRSQRQARQQENVRSRRAALRRLSKNQTKMCDNDFVENQPRITETLSIAHEGHIEGDIVQHRRANSQRNRYPIETLSSSDSSTQSPAADVPKNPDLSYNRMRTLSKIRSPTINIPQQPDLGFAGIINTNDNRMDLGHTPRNLDHSSSRVSKFRRAWNTFVNVPQYPDPESPFDRVGSPNLKSGRRYQQISKCPSIQTQRPTKQQISPQENFVKRKYRDNSMTSPRDLTVAHGNQHVSVFVPSRKLSVRAGDSEVMVGQPRGSLSSHQKNYSSRPLGLDHQQRGDSWKKRLKSRERITGRLVMEEDWMDDEMEKLKLAVSRFQPDRPYYWQKISDFVESRSPAECQRKFELIRNPCKRGPGPVKKKIKKVVHPQVEAGANFRDVVTAGRGTLKRKKQMRQFLEAQDRDYEDDVFESTPYRNRKKRIKLPIDPSKFSMVFDSDDFSDGNNSMSSSPAFSSSDSDISLPAASILCSADRDKADAYMLRYEKMRKKMPLNAEMRNTKDRTNTKKNQNGVLGLSPSQVFSTKEKYDNDEDSLENDDYFEDEDYNY